MKQTVTSKYEPKSKNVTWIDMSSGSPVQKNYINGRWMPTGGSGGGASSSNPTEADATKVWQVVPTKTGSHTENVEIIPEQTVSIPQSEEGLTVTNTDKFVEGAKCSATYNGISCGGVVINDGGLYIDLYNNDTYICTVYESNSLYFLDTADSSVTIQLSVVTEVPEYDYNWQAGVEIPIPTKNDIDKVLVAKEDLKHGETIVPEQEVVMSSEGAQLSNVNDTYFVEGTEVIMLLNVTFDGDTVLNKEMVCIIRNSNDELWTEPIDGGVEDCVMVKIPTGEILFYSIDGDFPEGSTYVTALYVSNRQYNYVLDNCIEKLSTNQSDWAAGNGTYVPREITEAEKQKFSGTGVTPITGALVIDINGKVPMNMAVYNRRAPGRIIVFQLCVLDIENYVAYYYAPDSISISGKTMTEVGVTPYKLSYDYSLLLFENEIVPG